MNAIRFKEIVASFLDSDDQFDTDRGDVAIQIGSELISARLTMESGNLFVTEGHKRAQAEEWIVKRLAMLPQLAERILASVSPTAEFVTPQADLLDEVNTKPTDTPEHVEDAVGAVSGFLERRLGGVCSVLYLTSDAGEGKTTLINQLARRQAERYKKGVTDWLLVPVPLGGRPFLRFDDVIVASLVNQLRFQRLYYGAFLHLVRMGVLVPALDGFEEIFVETSEAEAISSLGSLISHLRGEGSLLIAARKAYFEFRDLRAQAKLLDSLPDVDVAFGRVALRRWSAKEFIEYATLSRLEDPDTFHASLVEVLGADHPLLTRPVLARRLVELAEGVGTDFVNQLKPQADTYFSWLVDELIKREAESKWIDKHGEPPAPLLSTEEHHELLDYISEEMWISKTGVLSGEMLDSLAEIFCETKAKSPVVGRQVKERIRQHALIISSTRGGREFAFDHDDFREFFLGEQLARYIASGAEHDVRKLFRIDTIPRVALESAVGRLAACRDSASLISMVLKVGLSESSSTFVRENAGAFIMPLLGCEHATRIELRGLVFPPESLKGCTIAGVNFTDCYFRPSSLAATRLQNCIFDGCEFEHIGVGTTPPTVTGCSLSKTRVASLSIEGRDGSLDYYDPDQIQAHLVRLGFVEGEQQLTLTSIAAREYDDDLRIAEKALQTFHRSTFVGEGTFKLRLGINENRFFRVVLPKLVKSGILEEIPSARETRYRRAVPVLGVADALADCDGTFDDFVRLAGKGK